MENNIGTQRYIYVEGQAIPVTEEVYLAYYQPVWRTHNNARRHGQCAVDDWRRCQGDCGMCKYHTHGNCGSTDWLQEAYELESKDFDSDPAEIVSGTFLTELLLDEMEKITPDGRRLGELLMDGYTDREIAVILGISKSSVNYRKQRIRQRLKNWMENIF